MELCTNGKAPYCIIIAGVVPRIGIRGSSLRSGGVTEIVFYGFYIHVIWNYLEKLRSLPVKRAGRTFTATCEGRAPFVIRYKVL